MEIEPIRPHSDRQKVAPGEVPLSVRETLFMPAEDAGLNYRTVESRRWTAAHWPPKKRRPDIS
ncbi:hypothetical protein ACFW9I_32095 [[Kitasatospora] papulosa]|uniref:hypothetical protein n=1 Tax=[Kitasatospora] papulosa TaxID=1464011 RepID=UPI0036A90370